MKNGSAEGWVQMQYNNANLKEEGWKEKNK